MLGPRPHTCKPPVAVAGPHLRLGERFRAGHPRVSSFWIVLFALTCFGTGSAHAASQEGAELCAAELSAGVVRVQTQHASPQVTFAHTAREILEQLGGRHGAVALGLTQTSTSLAMEVVLHRVTLEDGATSCARPEIDITLAHATVDVMLAREIEHDGCVARAVLEHEMTHVAIEREALDRAAETLATQMRESYRDRVFFGDETEISAQLAQEFDQRWAPALDALLRVSNAKHAEYDERDSYGDKEACQGALIRIARSIE